MKSGPWNVNRLEVFIRLQSLALEVLHFVLSEGFPSAQWDMLQKPVACMLFAMLLCPQ